MNLVEKFLEEYKNLEQELRYFEISVLDFENKLTGTEQEQLKVCRIMRNYISHNDKTFLAPSSSQIKFLNSLSLKIRQKSKLVKDELKRVKLIEQKETIKNILPLIDKHSIIPLQTKSGIFLVTKDKIIHDLAVGKRTVDIPKRLPKVLYVDKNTRISDLGANVYVVTDTGSEDGKYIGILNLEN